MNAITTAADYGWLKERHQGLLEAYCVTLVKDMPPGRWLQELGAEPDERVTGVEALSEPSYDAWDEYEDEKLLVGVAAVGDWTLMVEYNGYVGTRDEVIRPLSRGRTVVSHFRNVNAVDRFSWWQDGDQRLHFEPLFPSQRHGSHPDELLKEMEQAGFDLSEDDDRDFRRHTEAAFALAQRITGVQLTPELFEELEFTCGLVTLP
ncbi:DUF6461 domain-containing protein [Streptomyces sp. NPDC020192]|uniref:DUF6461 domain-containing protein n=1 Tax=Streptomyces sp. NPDC020192 TaxID=3365066 RepID=UPI00379AD02A